MGTSSIEWTDKTWNPTRGCRRISPGCENCYAERDAYRFAGPGLAYEGLVKLGTTGPRWTGELKLVPEKLGEPLSWGTASHVFVDSMSDLFHDDVPREFIAAVFGVMSIACHHTYQVLTKRAARMEAIVSSLTLEECIEAAACGPWGNEIRMSSGRSRAIRKEMQRLGRDPATADVWPLKHVWLGVSVEDQRRADERIPHLLRTPAATRFLSCEPLLEPIRLDAYLKADCRCVYYQRGEYMQHTLSCSNEHCAMAGGIDDCDGELVKCGCVVPDWVIVGGESGPDARVFDLDWARSLHDQCWTTGVKYFFKQGGARALNSGRPLVLKHPKGGDPAEWPEDLRVREVPSC